MSGAGAVLVAGGAGYIGSHACKALARAGYTPICYDNLSTGNRWAVRWGPFEPGDIRDAGRLHEVIATHRPVGAMHFAALALVGESMRAPGLYYQVNVGGLVTMLDACRIHGVEAVVFSSTCAIYGAPPALPIDESAPRAPINPYGASKLAAERVLADFETAHGMRHMALRYFNAAGADPDGEIGERRDVETHLIPLAIDAAIGRRPPIKVMGVDYPTPDGTAIRDYIHVADLAEAHVRALDHLRAGGESRALNLGVGRGYSVREVLDAVGRAAGAPTPQTDAPRRAGDPPELVADPSAARALLGEDLTQRSSLETIVASAWRWQSSETYATSVAAADISQ